ncbi:MAG: C-terminal binding protein [Clostridiales Family XIII bacterium]|nr:C-terminal binding protein [Clostridiales Family XIII bacterium]
MKIVICDYYEDLQRDLNFEKELLTRGLNNPEIAVYEYKGDKAELIDVISDADAIINTYVDLDREILSGAASLKCIALNAVGYNMVDVDAATEMGIMVCPAREYCTEEVAEHTIAMILSLGRGFKRYIRDIETNHVWNYMAAGKIERLAGKTLGILGFGKIGRAVAKRAAAMNMNIIALKRKSIRPEIAEAMNVRLTDEEEIWANADYICNHMSLNEETTGYFNLERFKKMRKHPFFINLGRGLSVVEDDLVEALDKGYIRGAGLDVLSSESPDLDNLKLLGRDNVIITPHAGFYSLQAARDLQEISCNSVIYALNGDIDKIAGVINLAALNGSAAFRSSQSR